MDKEDVWMTITTSREHPPIPEPEPGRELMFISFGVQYAYEDHPADPRHEFVDPRGYLVVDYPLTTSVDASGRTVSAYERARQAVMAWLGGAFAFDYKRDGFEEDAHYFPAGETGRMRLP